MAEVISRPNKFNTKSFVACQYLAQFRDKTYSIFNDLRNTVRNVPIMGGSTIDD